MGKNQIGLIVKLAAAIVAVAAAICVVVVYSNEIIAFLSGAKEKVKSKIPASIKCCGKDEYSDYADV